MGGGCDVGVLGAAEGSSVHGLMQACGAMVYRLHVCVLACCRGSSQYLEYQYQF